MTNKKIKIQTEISIYLSTKKGKKKQQQIESMFGANGYGRIGWRVAECQR